MSATLPDPRFRLVIDPQFRGCEFIDIKTGESIWALGFKVEGYGYNNVEQRFSDVVVSITFPPGYVKVEGRP